jgi:hypothetical protein
LDAGNRLYCPQEGDGLDDVALDEIAAATELPYEEPIDEELHHIPVDEYDQPPVITTDPEDESVADGDTATFTVVATGDDLSYRWRRRTATTDWEVVTGETTATYDFTASDSHNGDRVQVEVYNDSGRAMSRSALLTVDFGSPLAIDANCIFWVEADRPDNVLNGSDMATMVDQIGAYDLTQTTPANQPAYNATGVNGRPSILGANGKYLVSAGTLIGSGNFTVMAVLDIIGHAGTADYFLWNATDALGIISGGTTFGSKFGFYDGVNPTPLLVPTSVGTGRHLLTLIKSGTTYTIRADGPTNSASGTYAAVQLRNLQWLNRVGFSFANARWVGGHVSNAAATGSVLTASEARYANKYGVTIA